MGSTKLDVPAHLDYAKMLQQIPPLSKLELEQAAARVIEKARARKAIVADHEKKSAGTRDLRDLSVRIDERKHEWDVPDFTPASEHYFASAMFSDFDETAAVDASAWDAANVVEPAAPAVDTDAPATAATAATAAQSESQADEESGLRVSISGAGATLSRTRRAGRDGRERDEWTLSDVTLGKLTISF